MKPKVYLALDGMSSIAVRELLEKLGARCQGVKLHDQVDSRGVGVINMINDLGIHDVWIDYKIHDTKDTVAARVRALVANGAKAITVHASGGVEMMRAAVGATGGACKIYAVTVLTSLDDEEIAQIYGHDRSREQIVMRLGQLAWEAGVHGIVCSALEVGMLNQMAEMEEMDLIVPGTRSAGVALGQQKRSATPAEATANGATILVAGSQVTKAEDPVDAYQAFLSEVGY